MTQDTTVTPTSRLRVVGIHELPAMKLQPRRLLLQPWMPEKGLAMVYAARGVGKTFFALAAAYAVASGGNLLGFTAPEPRRVLYIDGEMDASDLRNRLLAIERGSEAKVPTDGCLNLLAADLNERGIPDLATQTGQDAIEPHLQGIDFIVLDNVSTLCGSAVENESQAWQPIQEWLLKQRRAGRAVLIVHHESRNGSARGTSKREDILDVIIRLKRPEDYSGEEGARFVVTFTKARGFTGPDAADFEARLHLRDGAFIWERCAVVDGEQEMVMELHRQGLSVRAIADDIGLTKSKVHRILKAVEASADALPF